MNFRKLIRTAGAGAKLDIVDQATFWEGQAMSMDGNHEIDLVAEPLFELRVVCCVIRRHDANDVALVKGKRGMVLAGDGPTARTVSEWLSDTALQLVEIECGGPLTTK